MMKSILFVSYYRFPMLFVYRSSDIYGKGRLVGVYNTAYNKIEFTDSFLFSRDMLIEPMLKHMAWHRHQYVNRANF